MARFSPRADSPPTLRAWAPRVRVAFDGRTVTVVRLLNPVPGLRIRRYPLASVTRAELGGESGAGQTRLFELRVRGFRRSVVSAWVRFGFSRLLKRREYRWEVLVTIINEAVGERIRHVLRTTLGLAPWDQAQWTRAEALAPDLWVFAKRDNSGASAPGWSITGHREVIEREVLLPLSKGDTPFESPYPPPRSPRFPDRLQSWRGKFGYSDRERKSMYPGGPPSWEDDRGYAYRGSTEDCLAGVWHGLIDALQDGCEITASKEWDTQASALLAWGHHKLHGARR